MLIKFIVFIGDQGALFTGVNFNGYGPPGGFCFDAMCSDPPIMVTNRSHYGKEGSRSYIPGFHHIDVEIE